MRRSPAPLVKQRRGRPVAVRPGTRLSIANRFARSTLNLTASEKKTLLALLKAAQQTGRARGEYEVNLHQAMTDAGVEGHYKVIELKRLLKQLEEMDLGWVDEVRGSAARIPVVRNGWKLTEGVLRYELGKDILPLLFGEGVTANYTTLLLEETREMTCTWSLSLYILLRSYRSMGIWTVDYQELIEQLAMPAGQYKRFFNFISRVISPAMREINEKSSLAVECDIQKVGRSGRIFHFTIGEKEVAPAEDLFSRLAPEDRPQEPPETLALRLAMRRRGIRAAVGKVIASHALPVATMAEALEDLCRRAPGLSGAALYAAWMVVLDELATDKARVASRAAARASEDAAEEAAAARRDQVTALAALAAPGGPRRAEYEAWLADQPDIIAEASESVRREAWAQDITDAAG